MKETENHSSSHARLVAYGSRACAWILLVSILVLASVSGAAWAQSAPCSSDVSKLCHDFDYFLEGPGGLSASGRHLISLPQIIDEPSLPAFVSLTVRESMPCDEFESFVGPGTVVSDYVESTDSFEPCVCGGGACNFRVNESDGYLVQVTANRSFTIIGRDEGAEVILLGPLHGFFGRNLLRVPHSMLKHEHEAVSDLVEDMGGLSPQGPIVSIARYRTFDDSLDVYPGTDFILDAEIEPKVAHLVVVDRDFAYTPDFSNRHCTINNTADACPDGLDCIRCVDDSDCPAGEECHDDGTCETSAAPCHEHEDCPLFPGEDCVLENEDSSSHFQIQHLHATHTSAPITMRVERDNRLRVTNLDNDGQIFVTAPTVVSAPDVLRDGHSDWIDLGGMRLTVPDGGSTSLTGVFVDPDQPPSPARASRAQEEQPRITVNKINDPDYNFEIVPDYQDTSYPVAKFRIEALHCDNPVDVKADCANRMLKGSVDCEPMYPECPNVPERCAVEVVQFPTHQWVSAAVWNTGLCNSNDREPCGQDADCRHCDRKAERCEMNPNTMCSDDDGCAMETCNSIGAMTTNARLPGGAIATGINTLWIIPLDSSDDPIEPNIEHNGRRFSLLHKCLCDVFGSCSYVPDQKCPPNPAGFQVDTKTRELCAPPPDPAWSSPSVTTGTSRGAATERVLLDVFFGGAVCGDGIVNPTVGENCDDGNTEDGDLCPAACRFVGVPAGSVAESLQLGKAPNGEIELSWGSSCQVTDLDYAVYEGFLGFYPSHEARLCSTFGATTTSFPDDGDSRYYLVVPMSENREGSYGLNTTGIERPRGETACQPQEIDGC